MEEVILKMIVNKLGDPNKKVQCHVIYLLVKLLTAHKDMAEGMIREIKLFMQKPQCKSSHRYYATAFLNRVATSIGLKNEKVKLILFRIYFGMFKQIVNQ